MKRLTLISIALATAFPTNPLKLGITEDTAAAEAKTGSLKVKKFVEGSKETLKQVGEIVFLGAVAAFIGGMIGLGWRGGNKMADKMGGSATSTNDDTMSAGQAGQRGGQARQRAA